jgi:hypothetical protein
MLGIVLLVVLVVLLLGGLPTWGYHPYGMYPSGLLGVLVVVCLVLLLMGRL